MVSRGAAQPQTIDNRRTTLVHPGSVIALRWGLCPRPGLVTGTCHHRSYGPPMSMPHRQAWQLPQQRPWLQALEVIKILQQAGHQAVLVGGCVRDHLLGVAVHDCDIATSAPPEVVERLFAKTVSVGKAFGVVVVIMADLHFEVASFRHDGAYIDGRRPQTVRPGDEASDVWRRDFTINALIADPLAGEIRDHVGGLSDLRARCLRVVGKAEDRLAEDRLRILRALRFSARFGLQIEAESDAALRRLRPHGLSRERLWEEWDKSLALPQRAAWWHLLCRYELTDYLLDPSLQLNPLAIGADLERLDPAADAATAGALILLQAESDNLTQWLQGQPISRQRREQLLAVQYLCQAWTALGVDSTSAQARRLARHPQAGQAITCLQARERGAEAKALADLQNSESQRGPIPALIRGDDLRQLGLPAGPHYARILTRAEDAWLREEISDRQGALAALPQWIEQS